MRAAQMTERPGFTLMTQNDVQNNCYMQMPRWLFSDPRYTVMSLNAKVAYTFLLNRFQLSRMNGWVNDQGEVFVVFPRKELAKELRICEQSVTSSFRELVNLDLVWEKRCGRGEANQIYLAKVNPQSDPNYSCAPFLEMPQDSETEYSSPEDLRTAEIEVLDGDADSDSNSNPVLDQSDKQTEEIADNTQEQTEETSVPQKDIPSDAPEMPVTLEKTDTMENPVSEPETHGQSGSGTSAPTQEPQNLSFKNSGFGGSGTADFEAQEPQNPRPNKNNISKSLFSILPRADG